MAKFLLFVVVIGIIWYLAQASRRRKSGAAAPRDPEAMVTCAHCKLHFPAAESFPFEGRDFCCEEHRRLGAAP